MAHWHSYLRFQENDGVRKVEPRGSKRERRGALRELIQRARDRGGHVRAVGSGHSFCDILKASDTLVLMNRVNFLTDPRRAPDRRRRFLSSALSKKLVEVGGGITVKSLHDRLAKLGLGLTNMGTFNGQTISGAVSTSTHGSGAALPPFPDMVRSLVLVTSTSDGARVVRIEPRKGITRRDYREPGIDELIQDDDVFYSAIVSMGCMGVIESLVLEVVDLYYLEQTTELTTWRAFCAEYLSDGNRKLERELRSNRHFELVVAPHRDEKTGLNFKFKNEVACLIIRRNRSRVKKKKGTKNSLWRALGQAAVSADYQKVYDSSYKEPAGRLKRAGAYKGGGFPLMFKSMNKSKSYRDVYYEVFEQGGHSVGGFAVEFRSPLSKMRATLNEIIAVGEADMNGSPQVIHTGPVGVRFVRGSRAFLSPQYDAQGEVSVMYETAMLTGTSGGVNGLRHLEARLLRRDYIRLHWGLQMDTLKDGPGHARMKRMYPRFDTWWNTYKRFNVGNVFGNAFTRRMGLDVPKLRRGRPQPARKK